MLIKTHTLDDYDNVVRFLLEHGVSMTRRDKMAMVIDAVLTKQLADHMMSEVKFEERVTVGGVDVKMWYIDVCSYDDYDQVIKYLLEHNIPIAHRNKMHMMVAAKVPIELLHKMKHDIQFSETVLFGDTPLDPSAL